MSQPPPLFTTTEPPGWRRRSRLQSRDGKYWEPLDSDTADEEMYGRFVPPPPRTIAPANTAPYPTQAAAPPSGRRPVSQAVTQPITPPRAARPERAPTPVTRAQPRTRQGALEPVPHNSPTGYAPPEDRYSWGDYLRRSYPVIGVILLLGAFWVLASRQLAARDQVTETIIPTVQQGLGQPPTAAIITPTRRRRDRARWGQRTGRGARRDRATRRSRPRRQGGGQDPWW